MDSSAVYYIGDSLAPGDPSKAEGYSHFISGNVRLFKIS